MAITGPHAGQPYLHFRRDNAFSGHALGQHATGRTQPQKPCGDTQDIIQTQRRTIGQPRLTHDENQPVLTKKFRNRHPHGANGLRAGALGKGKIAGMIDYAPRIRILVINAELYAMFAHA